MPGGTCRRHATPLLVLLTLAAHHQRLSGGLRAASASALPDPAADFEVLGIPFRNRSLGLDHAFAEVGHQCSRKPGGVQISQFTGPHGRQRVVAARKGKAEHGKVLSYSPNRLWPVDSTASRTALVMALGGPVQRFTEHMRDGWYQLRDRFLARVGGSTTLVLLLDASFEDTPQGLATHLELQQLDCTSEESDDNGCARLASVDHGYGLYTAQPGGLDDSSGEPVLVLIGLADFPQPWWVERNRTSEEELVEGGWRTPHCRGATYLQTKFFNWYAHQMFRQLRVLDYFDFWMKMDDDVRWAKPFPGDFTRHLVTKHSIFFHSGMRKEGGAVCLGREGLAASKPAGLYMDMESALCGGLFIPAALQQPWFSDDNQVFTSEFVGGWLGFFTAPEVLLYGLMWDAFPNGMWAYRWGDQQFWKSAVGLFDDGSHLEDVSYVRTAPAHLDESASKHYLGLLHHPT